MDGFKKPRVLRSREHKNIIKRAKSGDAKALKLIYEQHSGYIFGVCLRYMPTREEAEEMCSDSFVKAFRNLDQLLVPSKLRAWLKTISINTCLNALKKKRINYVDLDENDDLGMDENLALEELSAQEIKNYIMSLPIGYRNVFNLYVIEGYQHKDIAEMLDISVGTSKSQLSKAKMQLREKITIMNTKKLG